MSQSSNTPNSLGENVARVVVFVLVLVFVGSGGWTAIQKYLGRKISHEKLATMRYHGEWTLGEYRECYSMNLRLEVSKPVLHCTDASLTDLGKVFNVSFSGDLTYDDQKPDEAVHNWLCSRNSSDPTFSCVAKEVQSTPRTREEQSTPKDRELTSSEVEYFRKRNECEQRFYDKKIYRVDGMSIGVACKQNPDRKP